MAASGIAQATASGGEWGEPISGRRRRSCEIGEPLVLEAVNPGPVFLADQSSYLPSCGASEKPKPCSMLGFGFAIHGKRGPAGRRSLDILTPGFAGTRLAGIHPRLRLRQAWRRSEPGSSDRRA
jgi:hypothetical protein